MDHVLSLDFSDHAVCFFCSKASSAVLTDTPTHNLCNSFITDSSKHVFTKHLSSPTPSSVWQIESLKTSEPYWLRPGCCFSCMVLYWMLPFIAHLIAFQVDYMQPEVKKQDFLLMWHHYRIHLISLSIVSISWIFFSILRTYLKVYHVAKINSKLDTEDDPSINDHIHPHVPLLCVHCILESGNAASNWIFHLYNPH